MLAMDNARREMDTIVSELRIERAPSSKTPPGTIRVYLPGELVYAYRERPAKWIGPFHITKIDGKTVYVRDGQCSKMTFRETRPFDRGSLEPLFGFVRPSKCLRMRPFNWLIIGASLTLIALLLLRAPF
jgi:hypothetical protein